MHLWMSVALPIVAVCVCLTIVWTALYGSEERSRRAFRLLRYLISLMRKSRPPLS